MVAPPVLAFSGFYKPSVVETDESSAAVDAVLCQRNANNKNLPIQYASRTISTAKRKYSDCEHEAFADSYELRKFRLYLLLSRPFTVCTDQQALKAAFTWKEIHERLTQWLGFLAEYDFELRFAVKPSIKRQTFCPV